MSTDFPTQQQMNAFEHFIGSIVSALSRMAIAVLILIVLVIILKVMLSFAAQLFSIRRLLNQDTILLQLIPPASTYKTPLANQELFKNLHGWVYG